MEKQLEVVCLLLRFSPGAAKVEWLVNGEKGNLPTIDLSIWKGTDGSYMGQSRVNVTKESWEKEDVYTCKVTHPARGTEHFMHNTSKCLGEGLWPCMAGWDEGLLKNQPCLRVGGTVPRSQGDG